MCGIMFAAMSSGSGKTAVTCAFLQAALRRGIRTVAFKCGPDYIDPMFHQKSLGVPSYNLDLFLAKEEMVQELYRIHSRDGELAVVEGVMGYYDGLSGITDRASSWHLAANLHIPVILVVKPQGSSLTLAAAIRGICQFRKSSQVEGILLNQCSPMLYQILAPMLEEQTGKKVIGYLPYIEETTFENRHLGLVTASEIKDIQQRMESLANAMEQHVDMDWLFKLAQQNKSIERNVREPSQFRIPPGEERNNPPGVRLAVAYDQAFCFYYEDNLRLLREAGAELCFFSPMQDQELPKACCGLYLGGGYPELYAKVLGNNQAMRTAIRQAIQDQMPCIAECGGFLYLQQSLQDTEGIEWPMAGILPGTGVKTQQRVRFGYAMLKAKEHSLLFKTGEILPVHEFHYWDSTENGDAFEASKPTNGRRWECGFAGKRLYAGFPHLYFPSNPKLAVRMVHAAREFAQQNQLEQVQK